MPNANMQASVGNPHRGHEAVDLFSEKAQDWADIPATEVSVKPIKKRARRARESKGKPEGMFLFYQ